MRLDARWCGYRCTQMIALFLTTAIAFLSACSPPPLYDISKADVSNTINKIQVKEAEDIPPPAPVVTESGAYVDTKKISLIRKPSWLKRRVTIHGNSLPFSFYINELMDGTGALVHYDSNIDKKRTLSIDYSGTIRGALDDLATRTDYFYEIDSPKNSLTWSAYQTRTFDVSFMPGTQTYQLGSSGGSGPGLSSDSGDGGSTGVDFTEDDQYSQLLGDISLWTDLETTIKNLMSDEGKVNVSQATTTVTVRDHPENIRSVSTYLDKMNRELSKQVRIQVQVLEVQLNDEFAYGIDWNVVRQVSNNFVTITGNPFVNADVSTFLPVSVGFTGGANTKWNGTSTFYRALEEQGQVSVVTQPSVTTLNNQIAQIAIQDQENYVSEISSTINDNLSQASVDTSTITTGLSLFLLPKVRDNRVFLQLSTTLSNLLELNKFDTATGTISPSRDFGSSDQTSTEASSDGSSGTISQGTDADVTTSSTTPSFVQLPRINARTINQRAMIPSGMTLILAGYKQVNNRNANSKFFKSSTLGAQGGKRDNTEIVILITPTILSVDETMEEVG